MQKYIQFFCLFAFSLYSSVFPHITYKFLNEPIDVVIPCVAKDVRSLEHCIRGIRRNGKNIRRVIVISKTRFTDQAEWVSEDLFPFSKETIALEIFEGDAEEAQKFLNCPDSRSGWILQQLLKLYAPFVIAGVSSNVLILDADVIFLNPVSFMDADANPYFATTKEMYVPYFVHAAKLLTGLHRHFSKHSGIAHHMLFQKPVLQDLFQMIANQHGVEPWRAICRAIDKKQAYLSSMSEYEIYFNFIFLRSKQAKIRPLKWRLIDSIEEILKYKQEGFDLACYPTWHAK